MIQSSPVPTPVHRFKRAKFWKQVAIGAIVGGVSMGLALASIDGLKGATLTPDEAVALGAGVIYSLIGLFVGVGALFPKAGSELLNVEDEEEIRDQRHIFGWGAVAMLLSGLLMLGLVLGSPGFEFLGRAVAAALVAACVAMIAMHDLGIPHDKINVNGGATALGHPIGASGARILATLIAALQNRGGKRGVASLCIGGGEATAMAVELV
jgi:hypothetical protein